MGGMIARRGQDSNQSCGWWYSLERRTWLGSITRGLASGRAMPGAPLLESKRKLYRHQSWAAAILVIEIQAGFAAEV
jgi:hypothetical protein